MDISKKLEDARAAMQLARIELDDYVHNRGADEATFASLYEAVQITTQEYLDLVKLLMERKYKLPSQPAMADLDPPTEPTEA